MGFFDFLKRRRKTSSSNEDTSPGDKRHPQLRDAWLAFENANPDRALQLAEPYLTDIDRRLSTNAKKLVGLVHFRHNNYEEAFQLFRDVAATQNDAESWFNVVTAATLNGEIQSGREAFDNAVSARTREGASDGISIPFMRQYYACALRDQRQYHLAFQQITELRNIYEQLKITDDTFVYLRGVPFLSHTMDVAIDVFLGLGDSFDANGWIDSFASHVDDDGRAYLKAIKHRLNDGD
ncbi:MAG: hypothetical protein CMM01_12030 [Rhodopirellula sp.]|nr:hypothetical protein [Rhodopirellula sp.]